MRVLEHPLTTHQFLMVLTLGAGVLALWINFRFPKLAPEGMWTAVVHVGMAILVGQALVPALTYAVPEVSPVARALVITFLLGLPALVYALLASIWVIRIAQGALLRR
jgi:hypothetical protein